LTVTEVQGFGQQKGEKTYRGASEIDFVPKLKGGDRDRTENKDRFIQPLSKQFRQDRLGTVRFCVRDQERHPHSTGETDGAP
jgi:nitrogen regulatory protein PII